MGRKRQREGIDVALQNGVPFGRPNAQVTEGFKEVKCMIVGKQVRFQQLTPWRN
ncbi:hypothetical protein OKW24_002716 [Peribacillus simplex]|nr:hypothetical protein [Peribacillus simplex]